MQVRTLLPPRVTERPFYRGTIHQIFRLPEQIDSTKLSELIASHRMVASDDGLSVAVVVQESKRTERIHHNLIDVFSASFCRRYKDEDIQTRILEIGPDRILVWGLPVGSSTFGIYELKRFQTRLRLVHPFPFLSRICRHTNGTFLFGSKHAWTPHGTFPIDEVAMATTIVDRSILFLEQIEGQTFRYKVGMNGFVDWSPVAYAEGEQSVALVYVQNQYVLATNTLSGAHLRVVGSKNELSFSLREHWKGEIEYLWVSPSERSLAWCVRPDRSNPTHRVLYLNGQLIHEGNFTMGQADLVWAPSGSMLGARILTQQENGQEKLSIVTLVEKIEFPAGTFLREFLIDTDGKVAATITDDGENCSPKIYNRHFTTVPIAWNLSWIEQGIGFSSILESVVCRTTDETSLLRH